MQDDIFPTPFEIVDTGANLGNSFREKCIDFYVNHPYLGGICASINAILR